MNNSPKQLNSRLRQVSANTVRVKSIPTSTDDYRKLATRAHSSLQEIRLFFSSNPNLMGFVTSEFRIVCVKPAAQTAEALALRKLISLCSKLSTRKEVELEHITQSMWDGYAKERAETQGVAGKIAPTRKFTELFQEAIRRGASDVHINVRDDVAVVELRINKILNPYEMMSSDVASRIIKSMYNATDGQKDFSKKKRLDAAFTHEEVVDGKTNTYMVRASSGPEKRGTYLVARIRDTEERIALESAGYTPRQIREIRKIAAKKQGIFLCGGPVNSGKSTILTELMACVSRDYSVVEIADPIEVVLPWVKHIEVRNDDEAEMIQEMKSMVRRDVDILVLGEIRSATTSSLASSMAHSGTSLWSTIHAPSIAGAFPRAIRLGIDHTDLASPGFLNGIVCQHLIPVLCQHCRSDVIKDKNLTTPEQAEQTLFYRTLFESRPIFFRNSGGCDACNESGISGITLVAEVLEVNQAVCELVANKAFYKIEEYMMEQGIYTQLCHGAVKVIQGLFDPRMVETAIDSFTRKHVRQAVRGMKANYV